MCKYVEIFTDGSCLGNPGCGGYGIILRFQRYEKILSKGYFLTTNNRMELMAIIIALEALKKQCDVILSTDSQYVKQGIIKWINIWKINNWKNFKKKDIRNIDLWCRLDKVSTQHRIHWKWIKGHSGHPENEFCDKLARAIALNPTQKDINYELKLDKD